MKKKTKLFIAIILLVCASYFVYDYMYQDHRDINAEEASVNVPATELVQLFKDNEFPEVLNSTVQVSGVITELDTHTLTIDNSVHCSFDTAIQGIKSNEQITIKGRCIGYDDLFEIVKLDQSIIIK